MPSLPKDVTNFKDLIKYLIILQTWRGPTQTWPHLSSLLQSAESRQIDSRLLIGWGSFEINPWPLIGQGSFPHFSLAVDCHPLRTGPAALAAAKPPAPRHFCWKLIEGGFEKLALARGFVDRCYFQIKYATMQPKFLFFFSFWNPKQS